MLPYKIRKPVYSGASKHFQPKTSVANDRAGRQDVSTTDADRLEKLAKDDPRLIGGNLQKAILLDLIDLRERFLQREMSSLPSNIDHAKLPSVGASFGRFKATFKDRRFGAIHTRAIPRNVDRGEYAQLLYSCCFYLLEDSVESEGDIMNEKNKFRLPQSIFAVFALFTLYQTNPLPTATATRQFTPRTKRGMFDEDALLEAWSVLPISREDQHLHRKSYKCPVRIDRKNYLFLMQLSDICKESLAQSANSSPSHYSLAQDASHIIDKMLFTDNFFSYCEYHGPVGLEGLAGNPHFYKEHFVKQKKKPKKNKSRRVETASSQLTQDKLDKMKNDDRLSTILNVSDLSNLIDKHKSNLQNITVQLQKSRQPGGDLQPKQRELVEQTLSYITRSSQQSYFHMTAELNADYNTITSTASKDNDKGNKPDSNESERNRSPQLILPESFSLELRVNVAEALADLKDIVTSVRNSVKEEMKATNAAKEKVLIDTSTPVVTGAQGDNNMQSLSDILAFFDVHSESSDVEDMNKEVNVNVNVEDDMSLATGAGKNALETLLKMAEDRIGETHSEDEAVPRSCDDSVQMDNAKMDDSSLATGSGMKALQNLLSQTTDDSVQQPTRPSKTVAKKKSSSSGQQTRKRSKRVAKKVAVEDDISVATGAGKNALSSLLEMVDDAKESNHSGSNSVASEESNDTNSNNVVIDESSVATGVGMKALTNLLSQTTTSTKVPKRQAKGRKNPPRATMPAAKAATNRKKKRQKTSKDSRTAIQKQADDGEDSLSESIALEKSRQDDISVASTTAAGKDALAALLSRVGNIEEV